ncbi:hypothetical protein GCM10009608_02590 [Pseudonocardia alaniniphila]
MCATQQTTDRADSAHYHQANSVTVQPTFRQAAEPTRETGVPRIPASGFPGEILHAWRGGTPFTAGSRLEFAVDSWVPWPSTVRTQDLGSCRALIANGTAVTTG